MLKKLLLRFKKVFSFVILILIVSLLSRRLTIYLENNKYFLAGNHQGLHVYYLDVGQGDATLLTTPDGANILIDGGPDLSVVYQLGEVMKFYDKKIDLLILTHPDQDHYFGLVELVRRYKIGKVMIGSDDQISVAYQYFNKILADYDVEIETVSASDSYQFGDVDINILYPFTDNKVVLSGDKNENSLVVKVDYQNTSFLFTGDLPAEQELELVNSGIDLRAQVVKAGHHGSKTSTSLDFLKAVDSQYVVISVGRDNYFRHPHYRVLKNIEKVSSETVRTDLNGTIHFISNGEVVAWE